MWKGMAVQAYYNMATITTVKKFLVEDSWQNATNKVVTRFFDV